MSDRSLLVVGRGRWVCKAIDVVSDDELRVRFEAEGGDWIEITVLPKDAPGTVFRRFERTAVRYRGSLSALTEDKRRDLAALVLSVAAAAEARLAETEGASIAEAFGRRRAARMVFGRDALLDLLSPEIVLGAPLTGGFVLRDVFPTSYFRAQASQELELLLELSRDDDPRKLLVEVRKRDDQSGAFARTAHFDLAELTLGTSPPEGADAVRALLSFVLKLRDHEGLDVVFPRSADDLPAPALPAAPMPGAERVALNLAIPSDCGQSCSFCSIRDVSPAEDGGDRIFGRIAADLRDHAARGVRWVRINGYDPLAYSRILDVVDEAARLGFDRVDVFSPCTRLADAAFAEALIRRLPSDTTFHVPLYAADPALHDRVVGVEGAHARVLGALDQIERLVGTGHVRILAVAVRENVDHLEALAQLALDRGLPSSIHMPYPSFESKSDRYRTAAPRQGDVAARVADAHRRGLRLAVEGVAPCVVFRAMAAKGVAPGAWIPEPELDEQALPGTEYKSERFSHRASQAGHSAFAAATVPCPHAAACALRPLCPAELLRSYVDLHGLDEIAPVSVHALVRPG